MAKKKQEIQLLQEIESQEEWEDVMGKEGLWVVDVYQEWSGHCDAMTSNFRRIKNELGDPLLHFAMAKADNIEALEKYRGSCEPCFLFFGAGILVSFVHGANAPLILRTLTEQLAQEHKVLDGGVERKEVKDPFVANREAAEEALKEEEDEEEAVEEGYTVALIKPNVVADGKVDDILAEMKARGIEVLAQEERQLTEDEAKEFYSHLSSEEYFDDLVSFMTSGPSHVLVLTKGQEDDSVIKDWRDMLGPPTVEDAKEQAPESLRAKYGQAGLMNALHGSDSKETAARELAFFFPAMDAPKIQKKKKEVQRTLALIRPEAFANNREAILARIKEAGFHVALQKEVTLTKEQAEEFYKEHAGQPYYDELTTRMSSGKLLALGLAREDAVCKWREMLGPTDVQEAKANAPDSLRAQFATSEEGMNELHGSESVEEANKEINFFFPMEQTVAVIKPDGINTKDAIIDKIHEAGFRIAARKETVITKEIAENFYDDQKDKEYFNDLVEHMISGPTLFMVLSREGAVDGWRQELGPTDPEKAKEEAPESLRAQFGSDVLRNAVHGPSSEEEAKKKIQEIFGSLEFNPDGTTQEIQQEPEEQAVSGSPVPTPADVAPEYRDKVQGEQEAGGEQPQAEQGQAEGEGQVEEKPAEEGTEKTEEAEGETKQTEQTEGETEQTEQTEQTEGETEQTEQTEGETEQTEQTEGETEKEEEKPLEQIAESEGEKKKEEEDSAAGQDNQNENSAAQQQETAADQAEEEEEAATKTEEESPQEAADQKEAAPEAGDQSQNNAANEEEQAATEQKDDTPAATETQQEETQETKGAEEEKKGDEGEGKGKGDEGEGKGDEGEGKGDEGEGKGKGDEGEGKGEGQAEEGKKEEEESKGEQKEEQKDEAAAEEKKGEEEGKTEA